jgi:hypothetical protein
MLVMHVQEPSHFYFSESLYKNITFYLPFVEFIPSFSVYSVLSVRLFVADMSSI